MRRLLALFEKYNIKTTWFIPGHSLETFPEECAMIRDAGHEIGLHGYSHENPRDMTIEQQEIVLDKTYRMLTEFCGKVQISAQPNVTNYTNLAFSHREDQSFRGGKLLKRALT